MAVTSVNQAPVLPTANNKAANAAPAKATQGVKPDQLTLSTRPSANPARSGGETWIGIVSSMGGLALAAWGLTRVLPAPLKLPMLIGAGVLEAVVALSGVGMTQGWGGEKTNRVLARVAGGIGMVGVTIATPIFTGAVAMTAGAAAVFAWPACVIATGLVGLLTWKTLTMSFGDK
jgi:hypothetical protein